MKQILAPTAAAGVLLFVTSVAARAADEVRTERVRFEAGADHATLKGTITGRGSVLYKLGARNGQHLAVNIRSDNRSANYNIYLPGLGPGDEALYVSAVGGWDYAGQLYKNGDHTVSVFLIPAAARRGETADYEISFRITDRAPGETSAQFDKTASHRNISFRVTSPQAPLENTFTIAPAGLRVSNDPMTVKVNGRVVDVMADDIDGDNSPEVAVIIESPKGTRRRAHVFTTFSGKSFGQVNFPDIADRSLLDGYHGGDEYQFVENTFIRRFPLHGKTRQLQFKMKPGEAMKQLVLDRHVDY